MVEVVVVEVEVVEEEVEEEEDEEEDKEEEEEIPSFLYVRNAVCFDSLSSVFFSPHSLSDSKQKGKIGNLEKLDQLSMHRLFVHNRTLISKILVELLCSVTLMSQDLHLAEYLFVRVHLWALKERVLFTTSSCPGRDTCPITATDSKRAVEQKWRISL